MRRLQQPGSARTQARSRFTDDLRRRCVMRAAKQRAELVMRNRMAGDTLSAAQIIAQELRAASSSPSAWTEDDEAQLLASLGRDAYVELMAAAEESMMRELEAYEQHMSGATDDEAAAREYGAYLAQQETLMTQQPPPLDDEPDGAFGDGFGDEDAASSVLCPLCVRAALMVSPDGFVVCRSETCALRLDARGHPTPLELLRERMDSQLSEHGQRCRAQPRCRLPTTADEHVVGHLFFQCDACGTCRAVV